MTFEELQAIGASLRRHWPLPFTAFEHYMLADDRPEFPMTVVARLHLQGRLDRTRFERALRGTLCLHPLLRAHVHGRTDRVTSELHWVDAGDVLPVMGWNSTEVRGAASGTLFDLGSEIGLRVRYDEQPHAECDSLLELELHHACCDGLGACDFIETLWLLYADSPAIASRLRQLFNPDMLERRGQPASSWWQQVGRMYKAVFRIARFYRGCGRPLAEIVAHVPAGTSRLRHAYFELSPADLCHLTALRRKQNASLNAWLLHEWCLTLDEWNRDKAPDHASRQIRAVMPVNLREKAEPMSAMNAVSMSFIDRQCKDLRDPQRLLATLRDQMEESKTLRHGLALLPVLQLMGCIPGGIRSQVRETKFLGTTIFSNLGIPFGRSPLLDHERRLSAGDVRVMQFEIYPPLRPLTRVGVALLTYAHNLLVCLSYDGGALTHAAGTELLSRFRQRILSLADSPAASPGPAD